MSGNVWMFSDEIDDEDLEFMSHDYVTYNITWRANTIDWESNPLSVWHMKLGQYTKLGRKC